MNSKVFSTLIIRLFSRLSWWQVVLVAFVFSSLGALSGGNLGNAQTRIYTSELRQAPWAPPSWLFGPAWTLNNVFLLIGLQRLLQSKLDAPEVQLLRLQALIWFIFFSFGVVYFRLHSPVLAAVWTIADAAAAAMSIQIARRLDGGVATSYLPLAFWTVFASTVAVFQALYNADVLLQVPALLH